MNNKKGSMELGVNSIVILIIALIVLGLAIGFVVKVFDFGEETVINQFPQNYPIPTNDMPLNFERNQLELRKGSSLNFIAGVYNKEIASDSEDISLGLNGCYNSDNGLESGITLSSAPQSVAMGEAKPFAVILKVGSDVVTDNYVCNVVASGSRGSESAQLFVKVTI